MDQNHGRSLALIFDIELHATDIDPLTGEIHLIALSWYRGNLLEKLVLKMHHSVESSLSPIRHRTGDALKLRSRLDHTDEKRKQEQPTQPRSPHPLKPPITLSDTSRREFV
jgi:hypothetical protein